MDSYDFLIYEFISFTNSYVNSGVPRFQMKGVAFPDAALQGRAEPWSVPGQTGCCASTMVTVTQRHDAAVFRLAVRSSIMIRHLEVLLRDHWHLESPSRPGHSDGPGLGLGVPACRRRLPSLLLRMAGSGAVMLQPAEPEAASAGGHRARTSSSQATQLGAHNPAHLSHYHHDWRKS